MTRNILNALAGSSLAGTKPEFEAHLREAGVKTTERAEDLLAEDWVRLGTRLAAACRTC